MSRKIAYYDDPQYDYQRYWQSRQYENEAEKICLQRILKLIPQKGTLVDIGAGFGRLAPLYAPCFNQCLLVDPSEKLLDQAKTFCARYKNVSFGKGFAENLPLPDKSYNVCLVIRTLHHLKNPEKAISEISRILKPQGFLILEFANKIHFKNFFRALLRLDFHFFSDHKPEDISCQEGVAPFFNYHPNQIKTLLLSHGFRIIKSFSVSNFRSPLFKKFIPLRFLLFFESCFSVLSSKFSVLSYFGPSIFILAQEKTPPCLF